MSNPIWAVGLSNRAKAKRSATWGGVACLLAATRKFLSAIAFVALSGKPLDHAIAWLVGASVIPLIIALAGVRLLRGKGRFSGSVSIVLIILDVVAGHIGAVTPQLISTVIVTAVLLAVIANGVRGAFALRQVDYRRTLRDTFE